MENRNEELEKRIDLVTFLGYERELVEEALEKHGLRDTYSPEKASQVLSDLKLNERNLDGRGVRIDPDKGIISLIYRDDFDEHVRDLYYNGGIGHA